MRERQEGGHPGPEGSLKTIYQHSTLQGTTAARRPQSTHEQPPPRPAGPVSCTEWPPGKYLGAAEVAAEEGEAPRGGRHLDARQLLVVARVDAGVLPRHGARLLDDLRLCRLNRHPIGFLVRTWTHDNDARVLPRHGALLLDDLRLRRLTGNQLGTYLGPGRTHVHEEHKSAQRADTPFLHKAGAARGNAPAAAQATSVRRRRTSPQLRQVPSGRPA